MTAIFDILGFLGGGWGTAVAAVAALILAFVLRRWYKDAQNKQADKDSKDQFAKDHQDHIGKQQDAEKKAEDASGKIDDWVKGNK